MKNRYIFLRHGQTIYQTKKWDLFYLNDNITGLTKKGRQQIRTAAKKLKNKGINFIYSSDFKRTKQTAKIVAKELGLRTKFDKRLRDIDMGIYKGRSGEEFRKTLSSERQRFSKRPKNGESWRDTKKRLKDFIKDIEKKYKNKTILIVSHGDPLWILAGVLKGLNEKEILKRRDKKDLWPDVGHFIEL